MSIDKRNTLAVFPDSAWANSHHANVAPPCWPVSGLVETTFIAFPALVQGASGCCDESGVLRHVHLPLRGQRRLGWPGWPAFLLPVELRRVNHTASTNAEDFTSPTLR
jgi:hypothetical protein